MGSRKGRVHNDVYRRLVTSDDDVVGMIAYSIYKSSKLSFCAKVLAAKGRITDNDLINFYTSNTDDKHCEHLRRSAEDYLLQSVENALRQRNHQILETYEAHVLKSINKVEQSQSQLLSEIETLKKRVEENESIEERLKQKLFSRNFAVGTLQTFIGNILWLFIGFLMWWSLSGKDSNEVVEKAKSVFSVEQKKRDNNEASIKTN